MKKLKKQWSFLIALTLALSSQSGSSTTGPACDAPTPVQVGKVLPGTIVYWNCPAELKQSLKNVSPLNAALNAFWRVEGRVPDSLEEFLKSPYVFISVDELVNPYQKRKVAITEMSERMKLDILEGKRKDASNFLGDIGFIRGKTRDGEPSAYFVTFVRGFWWDPDAIQAYGFWGAPDAGAIREDYEVVRKEGWFSDLSDGDKTVFAYCHYLWNSSWGIVWVTEYEGTSAETVAERAKFDPLLTRLRNPYTGGFAREVAQPSPGDYMEYEGPPLGKQPICFGGDGKIVKPMRRIYEILAESDRIRAKAGVLSEDEPPLPPGL